jgi:hypothetical protein
MFILSVKYMFYATILICIVITLMCCCFIPGCFCCYLNCVIFNEFLDKFFKCLGIFCPFCKRKKKES